MYKSNTSTFRRARPKTFKSSNNFRRPMKRGPHKQYIHPSKFVAAARPRDEVAYTPQHTFADFAINPMLRKNLEFKGYVTPSPIQDQSIPIGLAGKDVIGIANTGTGKTAAFAIPVLNKLMADKTSSVLIIAPTRELAEQIQEEIRSLSKNSGIFSALLIGGSSMSRQLRDLRYRPRVIVGTPGRIKDHIMQQTLRLENVNNLVLDEVDRMLDMGFMPDMKFILERVSKNRQSYFFSATFDAKVRDIITQFSSDAITVSVKTGDTSDNVHQDIVEYSGKEDKIAKLHNALLHENANKVIVFEDTKHQVDRLQKELTERGFKADAIHGGKSQGQRNRALRAFKENKVSILVATDVAARGIDVPDVTAVINYSTPQTYDDYTHRIGRAGRAGRIGHALTFIEK